MKPKVILGVLERQAFLASHVLPNMMSPLSDNQINDKYLYNLIKMIMTQKQSTNTCSFLRCEICKLLLLLLNCKRNMCFHVSVWKNNYDLNDNRPSLNLIKERKSS